MSANDKDFDMRDAGTASSGQSFWMVFNTPEFQALIRRFTERCISWEEFLSQRMPPGVSPLDMWNILHRLSFDMGIELPIPDLNNREHWYRRTFELTDIIATVTRACTADSHLYRTMTSAGGRHFLMNVRIPETVAAIRLDGLSLSTRDADILLRLERTPKNAMEQLVANTFSAMDHLPELLDEPFSRDLFVHLGDRLLEGVDVDSLEKTQASLGTGLFEWPDAMVEQYADRQLDYIAAYANHETGSKYDHDVLRALILTDSFRFYRPFKRISYQVGRLVAHLYGLKHDLPVLGLLPAARVKLDWAAGRILPPAVSFDRPTFEGIRRRSQGDLTSLQTLAAQLMRVALDVVEQYLEAWEAWDRELRRMLKKDPQLNDRQRAILGRALRNPEAEFAIRYHKNNHRIAYPTARRDFLELVDKGYLNLEQRGRGFVFTPVDGLQEMFSDKETLARLREFAVDKSFFQAHRK